MFLHSTLGKNFQQTTFWNILLFPEKKNKTNKQKTGSYIPCKLSPLETICLKYQNLFSGKKKKKYHQFVICWFSPECGKCYPLDTSNCGKVHVLRTVAETGDNLTSLECNYRIRSNYRTYPYKRTVKKFRSLQITASVIFLYFFLKAYVVGTHLNFFDLSMQFKRVPTTYASIKKIRNNHIVT